MKDYELYENQMINIRIDNLYYIVAPRVLELIKLIQQENESNKIKLVKISDIISKENAIYGNIQVNKFQIESIIKDK